MRRRNHQVQDWFRHQVRAAHQWLLPELRRAPVRQSRAAQGPAGKPVLVRVGPVVLVQAGLAVRVRVSVALEGKPDLLVQAGPVPLLVQEGPAVRVLAGPVGLAPAAKPVPARGARAGQVRVQNQLHRPVRFIPAPQ